MCGLTQYEAEFQEHRYQQEVHLFWGHLPHFPECTTCGVQIAPSQVFDSFWSRTTLAQASG